MQDSSPRLAVNSSTDGVSHDPSEWVDLHGDALYRFAILRVKDPHIAEDLVQETFLSALQAASRFKGKSSLRTWLVGILRHKILDHFRKNIVEVPASDLTPWEEEDDREFFDQTGHWKRPMLEWRDTPEELVESKEFWKTFQTCLSGLPESHRRAFTLREIDGITSEEICEILSVTPSNFWVMLHRARSRLRKCLDANWFRVATEEVR
ncbi:MAG: sigma-70 family RNA polymerase sigma factor [Candidatus Latescibacterota bacterium]|nr:MAG: sigma-70 family RNA polymerase sigma factor [Candidatus Latescibacterota bacterium]